MESINTTKEVGDRLSLTSEQEDKLITQVDDKEDFKRQTSEYVYAEGFTDMSFERKFLERFGGFLHDSDLWRGLRPASKKRWNSAATKK